MRPTTLTIGHVTYTIQWLNEKDWVKQHDPGKMGVFSATTADIFIRVEIDGDDVAENALRETLVHEILHGCWHHQNMEGYVPSEEVQEWVVGTMSMSLIQVLQGNPDVVKWVSGN